MNLLELSKGANILLIFNFFLFIDKVWIKINKYMYFLSFGHKSYII